MKSEARMHGIGMAVRRVTLRSIDLIIRFGLLAPLRVWANSAAENLGRCTTRTTVVRRLFY